MVVIAGLFGIFCKENASLLFLYLLVIECILYRFTSQQYENNKKILVLFFSIFLFIPLLVIIVYTITSPEWILKGYNAQEFNISERLISELSVIWIYVYWIILPKNSNFGFFHDDITIHELTNSFVPALSVAGHLFIVCIIWYLWSTRKQPFIILGVGLFYASHIIESTALPLELIFEHRNYFGSFGLILAISSIMTNAKIKYKNLYVISLILYITILCIITGQRSALWGQGIIGRLVDAQHHPESAASHYALGRQYLLDNEKKHLEDAQKHFEKAVELDKKKANSLFALIMLAARNDIPIKAEYLEELKRRLQNHSMNASSVTWLGSLVKCYLEKSCSISREQITDITQAALDNKTLDKLPLKKSYVYMTTANLLAYAGNNYRQALDFSVIAANASPGEIKFTINIVNLALSFKDYETAENWVRKLNNSFSQLYPKEIKEIESRLQLVRNKND